MQMEQAAELRKAWEARGNPPCSHPQTDREIYLGLDSGDDICTTCGAVVNR